MLVIKLTRQGGIGAAAAATWREWCVSRGQSDKTFLLVTVLQLLPNAKPMKRTPWLYPGIVLTSYKAVELLFSVIGKSIHFYNPVALACIAFERFGVLVALYNKRDEKHVKNE